MRSALAGIATLTLADRIQNDDYRDEQHDSAKQDKEADHLRFFFPRNNARPINIDQTPAPTIAMTSEKRCGPRN